MINTYKKNKLSIISDNLSKSAIEFKGLVIAASTSTENSKSAKTSEEYLHSALKLLRALNIEAAKMKENLKTLKVSSSLATNMKSSDIPEKQCEVNRFLEDFYQRICSLANNLTGKFQELTANRIQYDELKTILELNVSQLNSFDEIHLALCKLAAEVKTPVVHWIECDFTRNSSWYIKIIMF